MRNESAKPKKKSMQTLDANIHSFTRNNSHMDKSLTPPPQNKKVKKGRSLNIEKETEGVSEQRKQ